MFQVYPCGVLVRLVARYRRLFNGCWLVGWLARFHCLFDVCWLLLLRRTGHTQLSAAGGV